MTTKQEMIEIIKAEFPTLKVGDDDKGYTELSAEEYEATIAEWADARLAKLQAKADAEVLRQSKISAYEKLGLTEAEIEALLPISKPRIRDTASA
jgi:hypothetical protein